MSQDTLIAFWLMGLIGLFAATYVVSVAFERWSAWADKRDAVKHSQATPSHTTAGYVKDSAAGDARSVRSHQEPEREREPEPMREPEPLPRPVAGTLYTEEQLDKRDRLARDRGAAEAVGVVIGLGLLPAAHESTVMGLLFGPRGRRHQAARAIIADAASAVTAPPAPPITVRAGTSDEYEVPR